MTIRSASSTATRTVSVDFSSYRHQINVLLAAMARDNVTDFNGFAPPPGTPQAEALEDLAAQGVMESLREVLDSAAADLQGLKPKARTGAAFAGMVRKRLQLCKNPPGAKAKAFPASEPGANLLARLQVKHLVEGIQALVGGDFDAIDPAIGDASCEMRPFFLLDLRERVMEALEINGIRLPTALRLTEVYRARHAHDPEEVNLTAAEDIALDPTDGDDMRLWRLLADALSRPGDPVDAATFLRLCRGYSLAASLQEDDFLLPVSSRLRRRHPYAADPSGLEALARMTVDLMAWAAADVVRCRPTAATEAAAVVLSMPRAVKAMEGARLPLVPIFEAMRTVLAYECLAGRPLILSLIRLGRRRVAGELRFELLGASPMILAADPDAGRYVTPADLTPLMRQPGYVHRCFSVVDLDGAGTGLGDPSLSMVAVKRCVAALDPLACLLGYGAVHPPFADGAELLGAAVGSMRPSAMPDRAEGLAKPYRLFDRATDPVEEIAVLRRETLKRGAVDVRYTVRQERDVVRRLDTLIDLTPIHIHAGTLVGEMARLSKLSAMVDGIAVGDRYNLKSRRSDVERREQSEAMTEAEVMQLIRRA